MVDLCTVKIKENKRHGWRHLGYLCNLQPILVNLPQTVVVHVCILTSSYFLNIRIIVLLSKCRIENRTINRTELDNVMNFLVHTTGTFIIYIQYIYINFLITNFCDDKIINKM